MVLGSWLSADEAVVYWPTDNYRFHLIRESTPSEDWSQFPVNDIRLRDASEEDCEKLMAEMSQEDSEVYYMIYYIYYLSNSWGGPFMSRPCTNQGAVKNSR